LSTALAVGTTLVRASSPVHAAPWKGGLNRKD